MESRSSAFLGAIALTMVLSVVPARPAQAITPDASAISVSTPVCSYGRVDIASLGGRPGMTFFLDGAEAFRRRDCPHAVYMYKVAASWADKSAEYDLGLMYFRGEGVPVDEPLGAAWVGAHERTGTHLPNGIAGNVHDAILGPRGSLQQTPIASVDDALGHAQTVQGNNLDDPNSLKCPTGTVKVSRCSRSRQTAGLPSHRRSRPARANLCRTPDQISTHPGDQR